MTLRWRLTLILATVAFSLCSFLTGIAGSFLILLLARVLMGVVEGGVAPISQTMIAAEVAPERRGEPVALRGDLVGGGTLDVSTLRGKVVLINIWGSWCAPCRREAPDLQEAWASFKGQRVQFLGLNTRDDVAGAAEAFERRFGITYPSLVDADGSLQLAFRTSLPPRAIPSSIVLDAEGRVAARIVGEGSRSTFIALVQQILEETSATSRPSAPASS